MIKYANEIFITILIFVGLAALGAILYFGIKAIVKALKKTKTPSNPDIHKKPDHKKPDHKTDHKKPDHKAPGDISKINISTEWIKLDNKEYDGIKYLFWHVNNAMGTGLAKFPWDPQIKMQGKIKYFIVGIWPTWTKENYNYIIQKYGSQYSNCLATEQLIKGGIEDAISLILLCQNYAKSVDAQFVPFLLPPIGGWSDNIKTAEDVLIGLDGQLLIMQDIYNCPCQGVLIEGEEHYMDSIPEKDVWTEVEDKSIKKYKLMNGSASLMANHIFCVLRSKWTETSIANKKLQVVSTGFIVAWSEQGPMNAIKTYPTADTKWWYDLRGEKSPNINKTINACEFSWPDSYEGNWSGSNKWGHWENPGLLTNCNKTGATGGCPVLPKIASKYGMFKETAEKTCCAGYAKGYDNNSIGRYCVPANKYGSVTKNELFFPIDQANQNIFTVGGPGSDLGVQYSGLGSDNASLSGGPSCSTNQMTNSSNVLLDLYNNFSEENNYGKIWGLKYGNSLALYG